ncbi:MAG: hypothetical protein V3W50_07645 [Thermoanaerobaculia bacterium]
MSKSTFTAWLIIACLAAPVMLGAEETAEAMPQSTAEIIERILALRREMEALLEVLPPELQEEIERRWRELQEAEAARAASHVPQVESTGRAEVAVLSPVPTPDTIPVVESPEATTAIVPEPSAPEPPAPESEPEPEIVPVCGTLTPFDTNEDGLVSGADRYWRYLRLELEGGGASLEAQGPSGLYELGIRTIDVNLNFFTTPDKEKGDIDVDEAIHIELVGKGRLAGESGVLVIDADRLARGGEIKLVDGSGTLLAGIQTLRPGLALETADGSRLPLLCP